MSAIREYDDPTDDHGHMVLFQTGHVPNHGLSDDRDVSASHNMYGQFAFGDGAVHIISENINFGVYTALATIAGGRLSARHRPGREGSARSSGGFAARMRPAPLQLGRDFLVTGNAQRPQVVERVCPPEDAGMNVVGVPQRPAAGMKPQRPEPPQERTVHRRRFAPQAAGDPLQLLRVAAAAMTDAAIPPVHPLTDVRPVVLQPVFLDAGVTAPGLAATSDPLPAPGALTGKPAGLAAETFDGGHLRIEAISPERR